MSVTAAELIAKISVTGVDIAQSALQSVGDSFKAAGEASVAFIAASVKSAADFQQQMTLLVTSAGEFKSNIGLVSNGILAMSVQTATSAKDLADSMFNVESAGYHGAAGLKILLAAAQGAKIENADLSQVTDALTTTMHDFLQPANQAINVMNSFREAASIGKMRMDDFSGAMRNVGPIAALAKIHLTDVEAALSVMSLEGDKGASAGTHLAQSLLNMISPSTKAVKVLKEIGMTAQQVSDDMKKSLPDTLAIITDAIGKKFPAGSEAFNHALSDMFGGSRGLKAILELTGTNLKDFTNDARILGPIMSENAKAVGGWADVQGNFNFQMESASMAVNTLMIKLGTALLPVLGQLFQAVTPTITAFTQWIDKSHIMQDVAKTLSGWIGYIGQGFNDVFNPVNKVLGVMKPLTDSFDRATSIIKPLKDVLNPLTDTFDRANGIINSTAKAVNPMLDSFDRATGVFQKTNAEVAKAPNTWVPFWQAVKNLRDQIMHIDWGAVGKGLSNIGSAISKMDWGKVGKFFTDLGTSIKNVDWGKVGKSIQDIAIGFTKVDWGKVGKALSDIATALVSVDWAKVGAGIKTVSEGLSKVNWGAIMNGIGFVIDGVKNVAGMFNWLYDLLLGHSIIPDLINGIVTWFKSLPGKLVGVITGTVSNIVSWFAQLPGRLSAIVSNTVNTVVNWFRQLPGRALGAVQPLGGMIGGFFSGLAGQAVAWGSNIINNVATGIRNAMGNVAGAIGDVVQFIADHLPHSPAKIGPLRDLIASGSKITEQLSQGMLKSLPNLQTSLNVMLKPMVTDSSSNFGGGTPLQFPSMSTATNTSQRPIQMQVDVYLDGARTTRQLMPHIVNAVRASTGVRY